MKIIFIAFITLFLYNSATAEEITYDSYKILSQIEISGHQPVTLLNTFNPPMAVLILRAGAKTVHEISSGSLKDCRRQTPEQILNLQNRGEKMYETLAKIEIAKQWSRTVPPELRLAEAQLRPMTEFIRTTPGKSVYWCGKPIK